MTATKAEKLARRQFQEFLRNAEGLTLVVVDSPVKAKAVARALSSDYAVMASPGPLQELPTSTTWTPPEGDLTPEERVFLRMGVVPAEGWRAVYQPSLNQDVAINKLKQCVATASGVVLATDPDPDGEAVAWHLRQALGPYLGDCRRITFAEISGEALEEALGTTQDINMLKINAHLARRILDRLVGSLVTPLLWREVGAELAAGRLQAPAVRLVVERELEVKAFVPEEYWTVTAELTDGLAPSAVRMDVVAVNGGPFRPTSKEECDAAVGLLHNASFEVTTVKERKTKAKPGAPFTTATLLAAAARQVGLSPFRTAFFAQKLFDAGRITFPRTETVAVAPAAVAAARHYLATTFGDAYVTPEPVVFGEAPDHQNEFEGIRPTNPALPPSELRASEGARRVYGLIWRQFLAGQMTPAETLHSTITVVARTGGDQPQEFTLELRGRRRQFEGFQRVHFTGVEADAAVPDWRRGQGLRLEWLFPKRRLTLPPPRYTEAALVEELCRRGLGRPATYASIVTAIQRRKYVERDAKTTAPTLVPTKAAEIVTRRLVEAFGDVLMDYEAVARVERDVDAIAAGNQDFRSLLDGFSGDLMRRVAEAKAGALRPVDDLRTTLTCELCQKRMLFRVTRAGAYLVCARWDRSGKHHCPYFVRLSPIPVTRTLADDPFIPHKCPDCRTPMDSYGLTDTSRFHICGRAPDCPTYTVEKTAPDYGAPAGPAAAPDASVECPMCGRPMSYREGPPRPSYHCGCGAVRECRMDGVPIPYLMKGIPMPELRCRKVDDYFVLRDGKTGLYLSASKWPRIKEARKPYIDELVAYGPRLPSHYRHLVTAPLVDDLGYRTALYFSTRTGPYVRSKHPFKKGMVKSRWNATYDFVEGRWVPGESAPDPKKKDAPGEHPPLDPDEPPIPTELEPPEPVEAPPSDSSSEWTDPETLGPPKKIKKKRPKKKKKPKIRDFRVPLPV